MKGGGGGVELAS